jgi:hypothetical protein
MSADHQAQAALDDYFKKIESAVAHEPALDQAQHLLELVAAGDGLALVEDLLQAGVTPAVLAAALAQPEGDKRVRPRLRGGLLAGHRVCWLTSAGHAAVGQPNRRESPPSQSTLRHRLAPSNVERHLITHLAPIARQRGQVLLDVVRGKPLRDLVEERRGDAWSSVRHGNLADQAEASSLLGGVFPDLLVVEDWPEAMSETRRHVWPHHGLRADRASVFESPFAVAVEVELQGKAHPLLLHKRKQHTRAMDIGGWWSAVLWIVDDRDVLTRLQRAGLGDTRNAPGHYVARACDFGIGGGHDLDLSDLSQPWWITA